MLRKHEKLNRGAALALTVLLLVALSGLAWARAGGGGRYGGSGGGGGGGGDGLGILFYWLIMLAIRQPVIGVPLLIVAVFLLYKFGKSTKHGHQRRTIRRASNLNREQGEAEKQRKLEAIKQRDPNFDQQAFLRKVGKAFIALQKAWSEQDMKQVGHYVSDGILERFGLQIEMQKAEGYRNNMEDVKILSTEIVAVDSDQHFDSIHVEIRAQAKDTDVDLESGKKIRTNTTAPFTEYWSFLRKPGAQTLEKGGLVEGFCPNCGAPLELSDAGRCENCDSLVTSGQYDWVIAEITQACEWSAMQKPELIPGYTRMLQLDPAFNVQHIEDRASVIFWRIIKAWFENDPGAAGKVLLPTFYEQLSQSIRNSRSGDDWTYFREAAVGAVEIQRIDPGESGGMDKAEVLVKWSARNARRNASGKTHGAGNKTIRPQVFVLVRKHGVSTPAQMTFMSSHCPGCGAPFQEGSGGECEYCGRALNDGSQDWVLSSIERFQASRITASAVSPIQRTALVPPDLILSAMASAMYADGVVHEKEMKALRSFASSRGVDEEQLGEILSTVESGAANLPTPSNQSEGKQILMAMARMALADGKLSRQEKDVLYEFGQSQNLTRADVNLLLASLRKELYAEAKRELRSS
jgi:predicted lipid-binding transport protein (Tim44 family)/uncharacterized tellurite resistance protein B-like protein